MRRFNEFGIKPTEKGFTGDKIKIARILNREIVVKNYKIEPSKYPKKPDDKCLYLQIELNGVEHVVFVASNALMDQIERVDKGNFPFTTIIVNNDRYEFT